ncbi:MAG: protein-glutamate O-methyltransferase CheR [Gemmatimonadetes bacterium]|nr:protein-glutamate O-methyltransferase CheR [Gemmatimonadota bacterium]
MHEIAKTHGFRCDAYKEGCIRRRIGVRMRARAVHSYDAYAALLRRDPAESQRLLDALTIHVSRFYRNPETWERIAAAVLPELWRGRAGALRCWSAGCAAGEEPYTLAILLLEQARREGSPTPPAIIDATDYDGASLERAAQGSYPRAAIKDLPARLTRRYFQGQDPVVLAPEVRRLIRRGRHDLTREPPPAAPYDLVLCRNVVIYFETRTQERIASLLTDALAPGGYLVLGKVETIRGEARARLVLQNPRERIYRRR